MIGKPATKEAYLLLQNGALALAEVEKAGMRIDVGYLEEQQTSITNRIEELTTRLESDKLFKSWRKVNKGQIKLSSRPQLMKTLMAEGVLVDVERTEKGNVKADQSVLTRLDNQFVKDYIKREKLLKVKNTYIKGLLREAVGEFIHPSFTLHKNITYRGACEDPNAQNIPRRDEEMAKLIRRAFIPRDGHVLLEHDFKGVEVSVSCCYNHDPVLIAYVKDTKKDMHRDMAAECYSCKISEVSKGMRDITKNQFVFPEFYGSVYQQCAVDMWESISKFGLKLENGTSLAKHLRKKGIRERGTCDFDEPATAGTFEYHLRNVQGNFWGKRFKVYDAWKDSWWQQYCRRGWAEFHTGFVVRGLYKKNEIINSPIQGSAFHCLLWCMTEMVKWLKKNRMRSCVIAQIHDSMLMDVHEDELEEVTAYAHYLMTKAIYKVWGDWLNVPLAVETEIARENWFSKEKYSV